MPGLRIEGLHHVSLPVRDLARSRAFYEDVIGLRPLPRPPFDFAGAWYALGSTQQLHLIDAAASPAPTLRGERPVDARDVHFAVRVSSYAEAAAHLRALGYAPDAADPARRTRESPAGASGFMQLFLLDPDGHVIELNAERSAEGAA